MKKISLEEAYISPCFEKYCKLDNLLEYNVLTGKNKNKYNYLLDPDNIRFKEADKNKTTFVISITVPGAQNLKNYKDAPIFCKLSNNFMNDKVNNYNKINKTHHSFFGILPFNTPDDALKELKRLNKLNPPINRILFNGPTVNNKNYEWLIDKKWDKLWNYANKNKTIFYSHPFVAVSLSNKVYDPDMEFYLKNNPQMMSSQFGFHINDAVFYLKLYIHNIFERFPNIQWIAGHLGETLLWYLWRFDHRTLRYREGENEYKKHFSNYKFLKFPKNTFTSLFRTQKNKNRAQIMINTSGWFHTPSLKFAIEMVGIENICYSIDTPYEKLKEADDWLKSLPISKKNKEMIAWKNANNLLKLY